MSGIRDKVIDWAEKNEFKIEKWQKTNLSEIEREYENNKDKEDGKIDEDWVIEKVSYEFSKTKKHLSPSEERELRGILFSKR